MTTATRLQVIPVQSSGHLNCMRTIRNAGSGGYSGDDVQITEEQQTNWWLNSHAYAWLYASNGSVVGYGMILQRDDGQWSPSAGVIAEYQGRGYGKWIVTNLADQAAHLGITLYAKARKSNPAAVHTHVETHWVNLGSDDEFVYFRSWVID